MAKTSGQNENCTLSVLGDKYRACHRIEVYLQASTSGTLFRHALAWLAVEHGDSSLGAGIEGLTSQNGSWGNGLVYRVDMRVAQDSVYVISASVVDADGFDQMDTTEPTIAEDTLKEALAVLADYWDEEALGTAIRALS